MFLFFSFYIYYYDSLSCNFLVSVLVCFMSFINFLLFFFFFSSRYFLIYFRLCFLYPLLCFPSFLISFAFSTSLFSVYFIFNLSPRITVFSQSPPIHPFYYSTMLSFALLISFFLLSFFLSSIVSLFLLFIIFLHSFPSVYHFLFSLH